MSDKANSGNKLMITVAALVAGAAAQQAVALTWRAVRGTEPTKDDDSSLAEVVVFVAVSAATVAAARTWATRKAKARL
ncbi:MAG TPA: DUF4235 domain-containing protein [Actinomycetes bacterium]|nr:DUF4235 domain-containing protein [Actinomycetes bacterium]